MRADLTNLPRPAVFGVALLVCGCVPTLPGADDAGSTSASNGAAMPTTSGAMGTSMPGTTSTAGMASTGSETTSTGASSTGDDSTVMTVLDVGVVQCNPFTQDCPPGMKCAPYADDGGSSWNNDKCVPVAEDPAQVHEPCVAEGGGVSGFDNCDVGLFCWDVDAEENGYCIELCTGSAEQGFCEEPGYYCQVYSEVIPLCMKGCDPLLQDCDPSDVCIRHPDGVGFLCVLDGSGDEGQQHDPCMYANACDSGLICAEVTTAVECDQNAQGCCQPFCDLTDPEADAKCGGVGQVCKTLFEDIRPLPEYEHVGYCTVPM